MTSKMEYLSGSYFPGRIKLTLGESGLDTLGKTITDL